MVATSTQPRKITMPKYLWPLLALSLNPISHAQAPETPAEGVLQALVSGDIACYVDFIGDDGEAYTAMADFEICEQTELLQQRVSFNYTQINVMAAACEGDMECTLSETVWAITQMDGPIAP